MDMHRKGSVAEVLFSGVIGIVVFLIVLGVLNILADAYVRIPIFLQVVEFLNANLGLLIMISVLFLVGDLFGALPFPLNLPGPIFGAFGAVFLIMFLLRLFTLVGEITGVGLFSVFERALALPIYLIVFIIALIAGYIGLFADPPPGRA
ncbi:MAG: hypothetical protein KO254_11915 [Methanoculleus marisnigri]|uniref:Uncharacterized protein n=2 Tax=Methanoculleus TaxID=45989 RepID=A3CWE3_METMJ|nr:hypothetical protein Memar_1767 [Methanoculleus marisnigri JR1]MCC7556791.1 hypothetical protein [Methanoculleus marisnigri]